MIRRIAFLVAVLLAGCASQPIATSDATPIPADRILVPAFIKPSPDMGSVILKRHPRFQGGGCTFKINVNGSPVAEIKNGEKIQGYLTPGEHILGVRGTGICEWIGVETTATLKAGQIKTYLIDLDDTIKMYQTTY